MKDVLAISFVCLISATGQIMLRTGMKRVGPVQLGEILPTLLGPLFDPYIVGGLFVSFCSVMGYLFFLSRNQINLVFLLFIGITYVMVVGWATIFMNEELRLTQLLGIAFILVGLIILNADKWSGECTYF